MSDTETLTYKQWVDTIFGEGSEHGYITYVKEKERKEKKEREETELKGVDNLSDREVQNMSYTGILTFERWKKYNEGGSLEEWKTYVNTKYGTIIV